MTPLTEIDILGPTRGPRRRRVLSGLGALFVVVLGACESPDPPPPAPWTLLPDGPVPRFEPPVADVPEGVLLFGGFADTLMNVTTRVDLLDLTDGSWHRKADMPTPITHAMTAVVGDEVWIAGGFEGAHPGPVVAQVWRYNTTSDSWTTGPDLPSPRASGALVAIGSRIHYIGGFGPGRDDTVADHWSLDTEDLESGWREEIPMPTARGHAGATAVEGRIYVVGGQFMHDSWPIDVPEVEAFDTETGEWVSLAPLPSARSHMEPGFFARGDTIFVYGGRDNTQGRWAIEDALAYSIAGNSWWVADTLPAPMLAPLVRRSDLGLIVAAGSLETWNRPQTRTYVKP